MEGAKEGAKRVKICGFGRRAQALVTPESKETSSEVDLSKLQDTTWYGNSYIVLFGIVTPIAALVTELASGMCRQCFFDPIPSSLHVLLVALVPICNTLLYVRSTKKDVEPGFLDFAMIGLVLAVTSMYAVAFVPMILVGLMTVVYFGLGFCPLAPLSSFLAAVILLARFTKKRNFANKSSSHRAIWSTGGLCAFYCGIAGVLWSCLGHFQFRPF